MIKLYIDVSDVIHADEHTKHANCRLYVNFWNFLLKPFYFMMKKDHFKQKLLLWPQASCRHLYIWWNFKAVFYWDSYILQVKLTAVGLDNIHVISDAAYQQVQEFKQHSADLAMNGSAKESKSSMEVEEYYFEAYMRWLDAQVISNVSLGP